MAEDCLETQLEQVGTDIEAQEGFSRTQDISAISRRLKLYQLPAETGSRLSTLFKKGSLALFPPRPPIRTPTPSLVRFLCLVS